MLPHAYPFRFVDQPAQGESVVITVTGGAAASRGVAYPSLLGVEVLAQAAMGLLRPLAGASQGRLAGLENVRWSRSLEPGEQLWARARLLGRFGRLVKARGVLEGADGELVLEGDLLLALFD